jgi:hypothetical protein
LPALQAQCLAIKTGNFTDRKKSLKQSTDPVEVETKTRDAHPQTMIRSDKRKGTADHVLSYEEMKDHNKKNLHKSIS